MRNQMTIELIIGDSEPLPDVAEKAIITKISALCGGLTRINSTGYWIEDAGNTRKQVYNADDLQSEHTLHLLVTCEVSKYDMVRKEIEWIIKLVKDMYSLNISWVHCKVSMSQGDHFEV